MSGEVGGYKKRGSRQGGGRRKRQAGTNKYQVRSTQNDLIMLKGGKSEIQRGQVRCNRKPPPSNAAGHSLGRPLFFYFLLCSPGHWKTVGAPDLDSLYSRLLAVEFLFGFTECDAGCRLIVFLRANRILHSTERYPLLDAGLLQLPTPTPERNFWSSMMPLRLRSNS